MDDGAERSFPFTRFTTGKAETIRDFSPAWQTNMKGVGGQTGGKGSTATLTAVPGSPVSA